MVHLKPPTNADEAARLVEWALASSMYAARCAATGALQCHSPVALVFNRDMYLDIPFAADLCTIVQARQGKIDQRLLRANSRRRNYDF